VPPQDKHKKEPFNEEAKLAELRIMYDQLCFEKKRVEQLQRMDRAGDINSKQIDVQNAPKRTMSS